MQHRVRAIWIMFMLACGFTVVSFNLIQIQLVQHDKYWRMAIIKHMHPEAIPAKRGALFDTDGLILAQTQRVYDVRLDGMMIKNPTTDLPKIADALGVSVASLNFNPKNRYQLVKQDADEGIATKLDGLTTLKGPKDTKEPKLEGIITEMHEKRFYPNNELAAHVLGFTGDDGHGLSGMEKEMDTLLGGTPGERLVERDANKREIAAYLEHETPAIDGDDVTLTIKMAIQHTVEDQLDQIVQSYHPAAAHIIVMDPQTGEILAMGSRPNFDPNDSATFKPECTRDRCITDPVEPGSVFKIITLAGALNEGLLNLNTQIFCENGDFPFAGRILHDDGERHGWLSVEEVMALSSNIGFAKIAIDYLHEQKLYNYATAFGIGQRTGLFTAQGESTGDLRKVNDWKPISISRVPMGQEVSATPIQLVTAMSVIANGGRLVEPHLARQVTDETGNVVKVYQPKVLRQVISEAAAHEVAIALHQVTVDGTAKGVKITDATGAGFNYGGKTGTAQKFIDGKYSHDHHVASFIGFMPVEDPAFVALVMVDDPKTKPQGDYGALVSLPVFANVAKEAAQVLNILPDVPAPAPVLAPGGTQVQPIFTSVRTSP